MSIIAVRQQPSKRGNVSAFSTCQEAASLLYYNVNIAREPQELSNITFYGTTTTSSSNLLLK